MKQIVEDLRKMARFYKKQHDVNLAARFELVAGLIQASNELIICLNAGNDAGSRKSLVDLVELVKYAEAEWDSLVSTTFMGDEL